MRGHTGDYSGTDGTARAVGGPVGRGGMARGWPGGVAGGAVTRGVWAALYAADRPVTARDVAKAVGTRRESANRALGQLECTGWARRERGNAKTGTPDLWSATTQEYDAGTGRYEQREPQHAESRMLEASKQAAPVSATAARRARMRATSSIPPGPTPVHESQAPPPRLAAGELQEQVHALLLSRQGEEFSPLRLARALGGRSQGAVVNACRRLVAQGEAVCTCPAPLRFAATRDPR